MSGKAGELLSVLIKQLPDQGELCRGMIPDLAAPNKLKIRMVYAEFRYHRQ